MIDTHTHIYFRDDFGEEIPEVVERAGHEGVSHFILPNVDADSLPQMKAMHDLFPEKTSMAVGLHPTEVDKDWQPFMSEVERELGSGLYKGIGEVGIDLYWDKSKIDLQKEAFEWQLRLAGELSLPVIIHSRDALKETLEVIEKTSVSIPLIFHSFTGSPEDVRKIREVCDPYFGINGVVTYKNAQPLREALREIGFERILLETDSPYLTPVPHRGKRNESSYLGFIRDKIAEVTAVPPQMVEAETDSNTRKVFSL